MPEQSDEPPLNQFIGPDCTTLLPDEATPARQNSGDVPHAYNEILPTLHMRAALASGVRRRVPCPRKSDRWPRSACSPQPYRPSRAWVRLPPVKHAPRGTCSRKKIADGGLLRGRRDRLALRGRRACAIANDPRQVMAHLPERPLANRLVPGQQCLDLALHVVQAAQVQITSQGHSCSLHRSVGRSANHCVTSASRSIGSPGQATCVIADSRRMSRIDASYTGRDASSITE